jgi:Cof subfamily protein (haloacid dehalogenase superfamily)
MTNRTGSSYEVRMIAVDLDGTLLGKDRRPEPAGVRALLAAQEAGCVVVLASGRSTGSVRLIAEAIGVRGPIVGCNGAHVVGADGEEWLHRHVTIPVRDAVIDYAERVGAQLNLYLRDDVVFARETHWTGVYRRRVGAWSAPARVGGDLRALVPTKMLLMDEPLEIPRHLAALEAVLAGEEYATTISEPDYLEFLPVGANKGEGVRTVAERIGLKSCDVAAIGDWINDLEMLAWAGISGCVANAAPEVKAVAGRHVAACDDGGVAEFVNSLATSNRLV